MVELIIGLACFYFHNVTSIDSYIDPWAVPFFAAQDDGTWDRTPEWWLVTVGERSVLAQKRDVTRSEYVMEMSPALATALGLDFGWTDAGVAYGMWEVTARRWRPSHSGRYLAI